MKINLLSVTALILLFIVWITPGLFGRDPWKADEPFSFGIASSMIRTHDYVVPALTGEPFLEKPPLFYLTAAWFGRMFSPPLDLVDATRLSSAFFMLVVLLFFALAARELYGGEQGLIAAILLIGCVHLQITAHKLITDVGLFAGFSIALYGFALARRRPGMGGFWIGTGTGIGFLCKGLLAPGVLGITAVVLPILFPEWRRKDYAKSLLVASVAALPWLVIWPFALYRRSPEYFTFWFWSENFGRFLGFNTGSVGFNPGSPDPHSWYILNLPLLAWPVIVPAAWSLLHYWKSRRTHPVFQLPLVFFIVVLTVLSAASTNRSLYALPMLLPITLMAVPGIKEIPAKTGAIANTVIVLFFGILALVLWFGWIAMMTGHPAVIAQRIHLFQPDYVPAVDGVLLAAAFLYTLAWLFLVVMVTRTPDQAAVNWTLGIVFTWGLIMTLWLPALNTGSSYRAAFNSLRKALPPAYSCIESRWLGESERAMLEYFTGLETRRIETAGPGNCDLLLEQRGGRTPEPPHDHSWKKIWEFKHPSIRPKDIFTLYKKTAVPSHDKKRQVPAIQ